jgi:hypothetical protein
MSKNAEKIVYKFIRTIQNKYPYIVCTFSKNKHIAVLLKNLKNNKKIFIYTSSTPSDCNFSRVLASQFNDALYKLGAEKLKVKQDFKISLCIGIE